MRGSASSELDECPRVEESVLKDQRKLAQTIKGVGTLIPRPIPLGLRLLESDLSG